MSCVIVVGVTDLWPKDVFLVFLPFCRLFGMFEKLVSIQTGLSLPWKTGLLDDSLHPEDTL